MTFTSGYWKVGKEKAHVLLDGRIYFHERQVEPSYEGGKITGIEHLGEGPFKGRFRFTFIHDDECVGVCTGDAEWAKWMLFLP
ncbi:MAG TPA: hypothetical protein VGO67_22945 [Verrucomicrobiae bacterium]|jgi:hypothetical protein